MIGKKEREQNDLAEGPRSRTEQNDFKKVRTCPALLIVHCERFRKWLHFSLRFLKQVEMAPNSSNSLELGKSSL